jgi:hypothetical protein
VKRPSSKSENINTCFRTMESIIRKMKEPLPLPALPRRVVDDMQLERKGKAMRSYLTEIRDLIEEVRRLRQETWGGLYRSPKSQRSALGQLEDYMQDGLRGCLEQMKLYEDARKEAEEEERIKKEKRQQKISEEDLMKREERWLNNRGYKSKKTEFKTKEEETDTEEREEKKTFQEKQMEREKEYLKYLAEKGEIEELTEGEQVELEKPWGRFGYDEVGSAINSEEEEESPFGTEFVRSKPKYYHPRCPPCVQAEFETHS